ncbi:MAG: heme exporter protein CcmD [Propionivibrio sp.]|nr:heme exporter protein CcmD [Propionivibrio sp.]MBK9027067.1 heme exporter protein CcmD [Propionivibrio sp.]
MYWNSFSEFLAMGNHGIYVWGSVGVMAVLMALEPVLLIQGHKSLVTRLKRQFRAERSDKSAARSADRKTSPKGKH